MCGVGYQRPLRVEFLGADIPYGPMLELQRARHGEVAAEETADTLFLLEHQKVITAGRNTGTANVLADKVSLRTRGVALFTTDRGGDVTYHGPGQLVGYPIVALQEHDGERDIKRYVGYLEETMIRTCADFGVKAVRIPGLRGIWVGDEKIGAIGVRLSRWVTMHGFALNVHTDLKDFDLIVPCGLQDKGVTSLKKLLGSACPSMSQVVERITHYAAMLLDREAVPVPDRLLQYNLTEPASEKVA